MPQQTGPLPGRIFDAGGYAKVADIRSGRTTLTRLLEFSYKPTTRGFLGLLPVKIYTYRTNWRFFHGPQFGFGMIEPAFAY